MNNKRIKTYKWRYTLWAFFILVLLFSTIRLYFRLTDDFRMTNIVYEMPYLEEWEIPPLSSEEKKKVDEILAQEFYYLGKGAQSYAFSSSDEKYVLKFFKFKHLKPNFFYERLPNISIFNELKTQKARKKERQLIGVFEGYRLGYHLHKADSGLIYVHLNRTVNQHKAVTVKDKLGFKQTIPLDDVIFVLQEKAKTTRTVLADALENHNLEMAKKRIDGILALYFKEYQKGIYDRDHGVMHNTGFVGEKPIHLDIGKLSSEEKMKSPDFWKPDLEIVLSRFFSWLNEAYPGYSKQITEHIESKLADH